MSGAHGCPLLPRAGVPLGSGPWAVGSQRRVPCGAALSAAWPFSLGLGGLELWKGSCVLNSSASGLTPEDHQHSFLDRGHLVLNCLLALLFFILKLLSFLYLEWVTLN